MILCFTGALTLSIGFINNKDLNNTEATALLGSPILVEDGGQYRVATKEEQESNPIEDRHYATVITAEEQTMAENSPYSSGIVLQENGSGLFFFEKVK